MLKELKIIQQIIGLQAFQMLLIMSIGIIGVIGMARINNEFKLSSKNHMEAVELLSSVLDDVNQIHDLVIRAISSAPLETLPAIRSAIAGLEQNRGHLWRGFLATNITDEEEAIAKRSERAWQTYSAAMKLALDRSIPAVTPSEDANDNLRFVRDSIKRLISIEVHECGAAYANAHKIFVKFGIFDLLLACLGLGFAGLLSFRHMVAARKPSDGDL